MYFLYWYDYLLAPIYLLLSYLLLNRYFVWRHGRNHELRRYFLWGMMLKFLGCIAIGMIYEYYYHGSYDGRFFFEGGKMLSGYFQRHPTDVVRTLLSSVRGFNGSNLEALNLNSVGVYADSSFNVSKVVGLLNMVSFDSFLACSIIFCLLSYISIWSLFFFFVKRYNLTYRVAAFCTIYVPSILVWSSSIFKDTITFAALCWLFICGYYIFIMPQKLVRNILGFILAALFIMVIKVYILAAFVPFYIFYLFSSLKSRIRNRAVRSITTPIVIVISVVSVLMVMTQLSDMLGRYSLDQVLETASVTYGYIADLQAGSAYDLNIDYTSTLGILKAIPAGINVTLFRPYPWEFLKPFTLFASLESMVILYFTIKVFYKIGFRRVFGGVLSNPTIQFSFLFSLLFAFMVGISASNFGTLVRYKIPLLPFYLLFLALSYQRVFPNDPAVSRSTDSNMPR